MLWEWDDAERRTTGRLTAQTRSESSDICKESEIFHTRATEAEGKVKHLKEALEKIEATQAMIEAAKMAAEVAKVMAEVARMAAKVV